MIASHRLLTALVPLMTYASLASAQSNPPLYVGAALTGYFQQHSGDVPESVALGGNGTGGSVLFGGWVSRWIGIEFEPSFGPTLSKQYSYTPSPATTVNETTSRRDTFWGGQLRVRAPGVEPVVGVAYRHSVIQSHTTFQSGATYSDSTGSESAVAVIVGIDAPLKVASHVDVFPTFRAVFASGRGPTVNAVGGTPSLWSTGPVTLRYGAGVRVRF